MLKDKIGRTIEVYIDDMLVNSKVKMDHVKHFAGTFDTLQKYQIKLNPTKCTFGMESEKFLGFMVNQ